MKFEQILQYSKTNPSFKKHCIDCLINYELFLDYHRNKLKLGKIAFEVREINVGEFTLHETIDIKYVRQDTTKADSLRIDNRLAALNWKTDIYNVLALILVICCFLFYLNLQFSYWYQDNWGTLKDGNYEMNLAINYAYDTFFKNNVNFSKSFIGINSWFSAVLIDMCEHFKIVQ